MKKVESDTYYNIVFKNLVGKGSNEQEFDAY